MSSSANHKNLKAATEAGSAFSKVIIANAPVISEELVQDMEKEQKARNEAKKAKKRQGPSSSLW